MISRETGESGESRLDLDSLIAPRKTNACYKFWIKITMRGNEKGDVGLNDLKITGEFQCSPRSLPKFAPNKINHLSIRMDSNQSPLTVTHLCKLRGSYTETDVPSITSHENDCVIHTTTPKFSWRTGNKEKNLARTRICISWDKEWILPVSPPLDITLKNNRHSWKTPSGWLVPGKTYYCRVRTKPKHLPWSEWSDAVKFTISE